MNERTLPVTKYGATVFFILLLGTALVPIVDGLSVLGVIGDKTYLVVLHDNGELRNTGGITSVVGVMTVHNGDVKDPSFSYSGLDYEGGATKGVVALDGPESFTSFYNTKYVHLYDANVQYDFATYAPFLRSAYTSATGQQVDGVIAIDLTTVEAMLRITGPLVVSGQVITSRNLANQMYAHSVASKAEVTAFISALLTELLNAIHYASIPQKVDFVRVMKQMGSEKHLQLYMPSDFLTLPFSGARGQSSGDFIDVIDYNLGAGKADQGINRMMSYHIELRSDGSSLSNLTVQYVNNNWWNYTVFTTALIPAGAELVNTSYESLESIGPGETHSTEMTALTSQLQVAPHSTGTVTYHYTIPHAIHNDAVGLRYDLDIHKQAGIDAYTFYTSVQLPSGATLVHTSNVGMQTARGDTHVQMIYYE